MASKLERDYQAGLIKRINSRFDCIVLKNDSSYMQGIPDLTLLFRGGFWAELEVKRSADEEPQPNQVYYVEQLDGMSFAAFIYPENEKEVLDALQHASESCKHSRSI